ncbi:MAG: MBL fold metallo-hydrolase [Clostridia bacterium]|nr:MBL fold metallo-hydrolase [Clostridia bacterium]
MKKTYITTMPNHIGAFLKASECLASLGINITRVSYNKAVDSHTLFIDAEGEKEQLLKADEELTKIGYLRNEKDDKSIVLLEFMLRDVPGSVTEVLRLIDSYELNISYISSQENESDYQAFKMGLFVDGSDKLKEFLQKAQEICPVRVIDYNHSERVFDNSIFYQSFVSGLMDLTVLPESKRDDLMVNSNLVMQILDEQGVSSYKTFESISKFAELLYRCRGDKFLPRVTSYDITDSTKITVIEPPCGSNTVIIQSGSEVMFIDSGYALYREEMEKIFREIVPSYDSIPKRIFLTHADVDHCGLLPLFDEIYGSSLTREYFVLEASGEDNFREQNPLHRPYVKICKEVTLYESPDLSKISSVGGSVSPSGNEGPLTQIGTFNVGELNFEVYQGKGGHLPGETVLIDYDHKLAFTGDIYVNIHGMTPDQARYNRYAPVLMTSVDTDPKLCAIERNAIMQRLGAGNWMIFGAHGQMKEYAPGQ